jgi:hypothetical protein
VEQVQNGLASGFLQANGTNADTTIVGGSNKTSSYDPGIGPILTPLANP